MESTVKEYTTGFGGVLLHCSVCNKAFRLGDSDEKALDMSPRAQIVTCKAHREYQIIPDIGIAQALARFLDGTISDEEVVRMRERMANGYKYV